MITQNKLVAPVKKNFFKAHAKLLIICGAVVAVLLLMGGYALWSNTAWGAYEARYTDWRSGFTTKLNDTLALKADTDQERAGKLQGFKQLSGELASVQGELCKPLGLVSWQQQFVAATKESVASCEGVAAKAVAFKSALDATVVYIEDENTLAGKLRGLPASDKSLEEKDWEAQLAAWRTASQELKDMTVSEAFTPTRQKAVESAEAVVKAWDEVIVASKEKNKDKYTKAQEALAKAYDTLNGVSETSTQQIKPLTEALERAYSDVR